MLRKNPSGHTPVVSTKAYIDPTAVICGRVIIHDYVYVGPYAVRDRATGWVLSTLQTLPQRAFSSL